MTDSSHPTHATPHHDHRTPRRTARDTLVVVVVALATIALTFSIARLSNQFMRAVGLEPVPRRVPPTWDGCNWAITGLTVFVGVIALVAAISEWRAGRDIPVKGRRRGDPWRLIAAAIGCFAAAILLYIGSCLYPDGSS